MKKIEVVAAIIVKGNEVFATQRGYGDFKGWWEFPGGKIETGECPQDALKREIMEELQAEISVGDLLETVEWDYPAFHLTMHCFVCSLESESLSLNDTPTLPGSPKTPLARSSGCLLTSYCWTRSQQFYKFLLFFDFFHRKSVLVP